jgi:carbonic anhydrase/acetyltransferase-like protein (isoleucine patch superfamily)
MASSATLSPLLSDAHPGAIILPYKGTHPSIHPTAFIAPGAVVAGDVEIAENVSVWFNVTIRGDVAPVRIGASSNIQDGAVLHVDKGAPCVVGERVTVGHGAILHGTVIGDGVTIGMGAVVLSWSRVGDGAIVAAGALVSERTNIRAGVVAVGVPAKERGPISEERRAVLDNAAERYVGYAREYQAALNAEHGDAGSD